MPQPLKQPTALNLSPCAIESQPKLTTLIVAISNRWNSIELLMSMLLSFMLRTERRVGVALYFSAASLQLRLELIVATARVAAPSDKLKTIEELTAQVRKRSGDRNKLVHCAWATSPDFPDALIRTEPAVYLAAWMSEFERVSKELASESQSQRPANELRVKVVDGADVYREKDFREILERLDELSVRIATFMIAWSGEKISSGSSP
jgi:hypothetical protein